MEDRKNYIGSETAQSGVLPLIIVSGDKMICGIFDFRDEDNPKLKYRIGDYSNTEEQFKQVNAFFNKTIKGKYSIPLKNDPLKISEIKPVLYCILGEINERYHLETAMTILREKITETGNITYQNGWPVEEI